MNTFNARVRTNVAALGIVCAAFFSVSNRSTEAAEPARGRIDFERIDIPADQPKLWPKEITQFVQEPRQKFLSMVAQVNARDRGPRRVSLQSAHYEATLVNDTLRGGVMTASVKQRGGQSAMLDLGRFSFALEELKWQGRTAVWGSAADGRTWVFADGTKDELLGEWSCRGRTIPGGIDFNLQLPTATTSFLDLRIPRELSVRAPAADVSLLSDSPTEATRLWRIHCGGESHCRITVVSVEGLETRRHSLIVEQDMDVFVREEDLRFQLHLHLEALESPVEELTLRIPTGVEIYSAVYGVDTPVPIQRTPETKADGRLSIQLPGLLKGLRRTLHVTGSAEQKPGQSTTLPQITVENSLFDGGLLAVTVQPPLEVRSMRTHGYRQRTTSGERSTFQQLTADAQLILDVHRVADSLSGQLLSILTVEEDSWNLMSEVRWKSLTGGGYQTFCLLPPEWEVTDVSLSSDSERTLIPGPFGESPKLNWNVTPQSGGVSIVEIEFLDGIQPNQPRTAVILAQRKPPQHGQPVAVPLLQLLNCDIERASFGLEIPNSMTAVFSPESRMERDARPDQIRFTIPKERPKYERRWYRCDSVEGVGTLQINPRLQPVRIKMETIIEALPAEYRVKYMIHSEQRESQTDRLLVYLTQPSSEVRWVWKGAQPIELPAVLISKSQHFEWNLPPGGELWEISLPRTMRQGVSIEGTATNRWPIFNRPALLYVPQAVDKLAELRLTHPPDLELNCDVQGMKLTGEDLSWWYSTPDAEVELAIRNPEPSRDFPLMVSMQLQTLMSADSDGSDLYRAFLQLENGSSQDSLHIKLDPGADLQHVFVNGESRRVTQQGGEFVIGALSAARPDTVELVYRVPASSTALCERRRIVVPQISAQILGFFWRFGIPPSTRIFADPTGVRLLRPPAVSSWNERLFGPLGRSANERIFEPFRGDSWRQLFQSSPVSIPSTGIMDDDFVTSVEWQAVSPDLPEEIWIELWQAERLQLLGWISVGICLLLAIILRMRNWKHRDRLAACALGLFLAGAFTVSSPYTNFFGGATAGMVIGLLIPRSLLVRSRLTSTLPENQQPAPRGAVLMLILGGLTAYCAYSLIEFAAFAQETVSEEPISNKRPVVYVPVDQNGQPSDSLRWVYVPREALEQWKAIASDLETEPGYLISSARYSLNQITDGSMTLTAKYHVHLFAASDGPVTVALPLAEVSLPDADSCRVNGIPFPISVLPNGKGYSIELTPPERTTTPFESENQETEASTFEIELRARKHRPQTTEIDLEIPSVANSHLELSLADPTPFTEIIGAQGATERAEKSNSVTVELGSTSRVQIQCGNSVPARKQTRITASMLQHLELHAGYSELHFHLVAGIDEGSLDALDLKLPPNAVVRKIQSRDDDFLQCDVINSNPNQRRLRMVFEKPHKSPVIVDGTMVLSQSDSLVKTPLPHFGLAKSEWYEFHYDRNWWGVGVSASSDFRLDSANLDPENVVTISSDVYLDAWKSAADPGQLESLIRHQPQFTFELREGTIPSFTLMPYPLRRRAIEWKQFGYVGRHRLEWMAEGEIETSHASIFQMAFFVDRRLRIEEVSVKENDAERKTRWAELRADPSRVVVFLSDKTQGVQKIKLRGSLPLVSGTPIPLPSIRVEDCEMGNTQLVLAHDPDIEVNFTPPPEWKLQPIDDSSLHSFHPGSVKVIGTFLLNDLLVRGLIQTASRHARCSSRMAVALSHGDGPNWKLKCRLEMTPEDESPVRMGLTFPAAFTDLNSLTVERAELDWHEPRDGLRQLDLLLNRNEPHGTVILQFEMTVNEPRQNEWDLPLPTPLYPKSDETLISVEPRGIWFPKGGRELLASNLPEWSSQFYKGIPDDRTVFGALGPVIQLQRDIVKSDSRAPSIRLLDQRIWIHADGQRTGITQAFLSSLRSDLELELPAGIKVTSVFLDDHPLAMVQPARTLLVIPATDMKAESQLIVTWTVDRNGLAEATTEPFLHPRNINIIRNLVTILPDAPIEVYGRSNLATTSSVDQGLDRLEALLDRHDALSIDTYGAQVNRWMLEQLYTKLKTNLPLVVSRPNEQVDSRLRRWSRIVKRLNQLESAPTLQSISWSNRLLDRSDGDSMESLQGSPTNGEFVEVWQFDRHWIQVGSSILLATILIPLLRRIIRVEWSAWLHRNVAISWLLLAIVWWIFLTPSVFGTVLLIVAIIRAAAQYRAEKSVTANVA